jgi:hypothetical protein
MKFFLPFFLLFLLSTSAFAQIRITSIDPDNNTMVISNYADQSIDLSNYRLCSLFEYDALNASTVTVINGSLNVEANGELEISWDASTGFTDASDMGLYLPTGSFGSASSMVDFVQWGAGGLGRENVAVSAGFWSAGDFLTGTGPFAFSGTEDQFGIEFWGEQSGDLDVVINEVDVDQAGGDNMEFVELFGTPNTPLDGMSLILVNGNDDLSYDAFDLDGVSLNEDGFALIGNSALGAVDFVLPNGVLQNGPDAVVLIFGDAADFPNDTPVLEEDIIDALVYVTNDTATETLLMLLNEGQEAVDESSNGPSSVNSMSRIPDGGTPRNTDTYQMQPPTPGVSNVLLCDGGALFIEGGTETAIEVCVDEATAVVAFEFTSAVPEADYLYVLTTTDDEIIEVVQGVDEYDFAGSPSGVCNVHRISYAGNLDLSGAVEGADLALITADECLSVSNGFIEVTKTDCTIPTCDPGSIELEDGLTDGAICVDGENTTLNFVHVPTELDFEELFVITTEDDEIIATTDEPFYDFFGFAPGFCRIYALTYQGDLDEASIAQDELASNISASICASLSSNFLTIQKLECPTDGACTEIFFSEYIEGTGQNKALEIYNPTPFPVDLSNYTVSVFNNGSATPTNQLALSGELVPGEVVVIGNTEASTFIQVETDIFSVVSWYSGNDAIVLYNDGVAIDILGVIGEDPGLAWTVNGVPDAMEQNTLVRNPLITAGETDWSLGQNQWTVYGVNNFDFLGFHTMVPCNFNEEPSISFTSENENVIEGNFVEVAVSINFPSSDIIASVNYLGGTATVDSDFTSIFPLELNFPEGDFGLQTFTVQTLDDEEVEEDETIELELVAVTEGVQVSLGVMTITILASDQEIPVLPIGDVNQEDTDGTALSLDLECELRGVVHGVNMGATGTQFTLIDNTGGIGIFNGGNDFGYPVNEGDSIHAVGVIEQFNGLTQLFVDTLIFQTSGSDLMEPMLISTLDESTESQMVRMNCVRLLDPSQWTNQAPGFNVEISDGLNTITMRIDEQVDLFGTEAPEGKFSVIGIGGQFDTSAPFDEGYQLLPRYSADIFDNLVASFDAPDEWNILDGAVSFNSESTGAFLHDWDFGDDTNSVEVNPQHVYDELGVYTVNLTVFSEDGLCNHSTTQQVNVIIVDIEEEALELIELFPNPANSIVHITGLIAGAELELRGADGRQIARHQVNSDTFQLNVDTLSSGVYLLTVNQGQNSRTLRLMVR